MSRSKVIPIETVIRDVDAVPEGKVITAHDGPFPLSEEQQKHFCIIRGTSITDILLVSQEMHNSNSYVSLTQQFATAVPPEAHKGFKPRKIEARQATSEVLRITYSRHLASKTNSFGDMTTIEKLITKIVNNASEAKASDIDRKSVV